MQAQLQHVGIEVGHRVLDVGFRDTEELKQIAACVGATGYAAGIDINPQHVEAVRGELGRLPLGNVTADRGSMLDVPFDDRTFDVIFCKGVLHEVRRIGKALEEMARVCRAGGILCVVDVKRFSRFKFEVYRYGVLGFAASGPATSIRASPAIGCSSGFAGSVSKKITTRISRRRGVWASTASNRSCSGPVGCHLESGRRERVVKSSLGAENGEQVDPLER